MPRTPLKISRLVLGGAALAAAGAIALSVSASAVAPDGGLHRLTLDAAGAEAGGFAGNPSVSDDGRTVAFASTHDLTQPGAPAFDGMQVLATVDGVHRLVSATPAGAPAAGGADRPVVSGDGRYVVFESYASDLVAGDTNGATDVFRAELTTGEVERVSFAPDGSQYLVSSYTPAISADGHVVAFTVSTNPVRVVVRDLRTGSTTEVVAPAGFEGASLGSPSLSGDGATLAFAASRWHLDPTTGLETQQSGVFLQELGAPAQRLDLVDDRGNPFTHPDPVNGVRLSPDGRRIVVMATGVSYNGGDWRFRGVMYDAEVSTGVARQLGAWEHGGGPFGTPNMADFSSDSSAVGFYGDSSYLLVDLTTRSVHVLQPPGSAYPGGISLGDTAYAFSTNVAIDEADTNRTADVYAGRLRTSPRSPSTTTSTAPPPASTTTSTAPPRPAATTSAAAPLGEGAATNADATPDDPIGTSVSAPAGAPGLDGMVATIDEAADGDVTGPGYDLLGSVVRIDVSNGTDRYESAEHPLTIGFSLDGSRRAGIPLEEIAVVRVDDVTGERRTLPLCDSPAVAPCFTRSEDGPDGDVFLTVLTDHASLWSLVHVTDADAPVVTWAPHPSTYDVDQRVVLTCTIVDDGVGTDATCPTYDRAAAGLPLGVQQTVEITATDRAGNTVVSSTTFTVRATARGLCGLTKQLVPDTSLAKALCTKLDQRAFTAYANQVAAKAGKGISRPVAELLTAIARTLR